MKDETCKTELRFVQKSLFPREKMLVLPFNSLWLIWTSYPCIPRDINHIVNKFTLHACICISHPQTYQPTYYFTITRYLFSSSGFSSIHCSFVINCSRTTISRACLSTRTNFRGCMIGITFIVYQSKLKNVERYFCFPFYMYCMFARWMHTDCIVIVKLD